MIRVASPQLVGNELEYVTECVRSGWLSSGPFVERLEKEFAAVTRAPHALAVANGTVALHLALLAAGVTPGTEVILPALTYVATANAVRYCHAVPVFVDVDDQTWCMRPEQVERRISARTSAVLAVHLYGAMPNMDALADAAGAVPIIEDAAEGFGSYWRGAHAGTIGRIGTFSFFGNKTITCGEGGMVTFQRVEDYELARRLSRQGVAAPEPGQHWYSHDIVGYNYRLTDLQAAVALAQLESREWHLQQRERVSAFYLGARWPKGTGFQEEHGLSSRAPWMFAVLVPEGVSRDVVMRAMRDDDIETRPVFQPVPELRPYLSAPMTWETSREISQRGICLPTHAGLAPLDLARVVESFNGAVRIASEVKG